MLSTPSSSARRHASRSSWIVHCCGWIVTPTLKRFSSDIGRDYPLPLMSARLTPIEVDPKTATPDFWKRYHAYRRMRDAETRPDDPAIPDDVVEGEMKRDDPFDKHYHYEIARDPLMLSWFT